MNTFVIFTIVTVGLVAGLTPGLSQPIPVERLLSLRLRLFYAALLSKGQEFVGPGNYTCTKNGAWPHEELCEYYYDCWEGYATLGHCTNGMLFDLKYMGCNYPASVDCGNRIRPDETTNPNPTTTTKLPSSNPANLPPEEFKCPMSDGLFANPQDCKSFYQCSHSFPYLLNCPDGLVYNPNLPGCDYASNYECEISRAGK